MKHASTLLAGLAIAALATAGLGTPADAKGRHVHIHKHGGVKHHFVFHKRHRFYHAPIVIHGGCGYERHMWLKTGLKYWKARYYTCKGWW
jgi:hypothetical protein